MNNDLEALLSCFLPLGPRSSPGEEDEYNLSALHDLLEDLGDKRKDKVNNVWVYQCVHRPTLCSLFPDVKVTVPCSGCAYGYSKERPEFKTCIILFQDDRYILYSNVCPTCLGTKQMRLPANRAWSPYHIWIESNSSWHCVLPGPGKPNLVIHNQGPYALKYSSDVEAPGMSIEGERFTLITR